ncbi:MAG: NAD(P)H-binding protein [Myxococcales bacterium]|nr:NAD(P)H-binding protein [Myxococcales bacterium]
MAKILVLGSTGSVGKFLAAQLVASGHQVFGATRHQGEHPVPGVEARVLELTDPSTFASALEGVERLFVLAPPGFADTYALLRPFLAVAFAKPSLERVATMSAQGVEVSDEIPLRKVELLAEASGKDWVHLRPNWFMQNFHTFWGTPVREFQTIPLPAEDARVGFIDVRDIADAAAAALSKPASEVCGQAWTLTGPASLTHAEAAASLSHGLGKTITYQDISDEAFRENLKPSGLPEDYIGLLSMLFSAVRAGGAAPLTDAVKQLSGHEPRSLDGYVRDYAEALA